MKRVGRSTFRKVYWLPLLCLAAAFVLSVVVSAGLGGPSSEAWECPLLAALAGAFGVWLLFGRAVACLLAPVFVSTLSCPGCGEKVDAVGVWDCGCGYRDHRERHILSGRCPLCGKTAGRVNCPGCGSTILLW